MRHIYKSFDMTNSIFGPHIMILAITTVLILRIKCTATFNMRSLPTSFVLLTSTMTSAPTFTKLSNLTLSSLNVPIAAPTKRQNIILYLLQSG